MSDSIQGLDSLEEHGESFSIIDDEFLDLSDDPCISLDDTTYIHRKYSSSKLGPDLLKRYTAKVNRIRSMRFSSFLKVVGDAKNGFELLPLKSIKPSLPEYPDWDSPNTSFKQVCVFRYTGAHRFAGHFHREKRSVFVFWIAAKANDIYNH